MTARDRAIEVAHRITCATFTRALFLRVLEDDSEAGKNARELLRILTKAFEEDRRAIAAETATN